MTMSCDDAGTKPIRRLEVFTGAGHRREWSDEAKAAIAAESCTDGESVSAVARRYALMPSQLFTWRRDARRAAEAALVPPTAPAREPFFVPAVIEPKEMPTAPGPVPGRRKRRARRAREAAVVELEIDGVAVKIARGADAGVIAAVIDALKISR